MKSYEDYLNSPIRMFETFSFVRTLACCDLAMRGLETGEVV